MIDIKRAVSENRQVSFMYFCENTLWYQTEFGETFGVPVEDVGNATFLNKDKALLFMRYMRVRNEELKKLNEHRQNIMNFGDRHHGVSRGD